MCAELRIGFMNYIFAHSMALLQQRISTNFLTSLHITYQVVTALPNCDFWVHKNLIQNDLNVDALLRKFPNLTKLVILGENSLLTILTSISLIAQLSGQALDGLKTFI
jgi:hypothetical protein